MLFSLSGTTSINENGQYLGALYALEKYRQHKKKQEPEVEVIVRDLRSDPQEAVKQVTELPKSGVSLFVGCSTSACRKAVLPVLEKYNCLLFFPLLYEGEESHSHVLYTGEVPNQQIVSLLNFSNKTCRSQDLFSRLRFYLS